MDMNKAFSRRTLLKAGIVAGVVAPLMGTASAADLPMLDAADPVGKTFGYVPKSEKSGQTCASCVQFTGKPGDAAGTCKIFAGKRVASGGWCSAYLKKS